MIPEDRTEPIDRTELRRWSAEDLLGWKLRTVRFEPIDEEIQVWFKDDEFMSYFDDWTPDSGDAPMWQLRRVIEKMRELGFAQFNLHWNRFLDRNILYKNSGSYVCVFGKTDYEFGEAIDKEMGIAVLLAARAAWESGR